MSVSKPPHRLQIWLPVFKPRTIREFFDALSKPLKLWLKNRTRTLKTGTMLLANSISPFKQQLI